MANAHSTSDIIKGALHLAGELTDGTSAYHAAALKYINRIYLAILSGASEFGIELGENWVWGRASVPRAFVLQPAYDTGTVTMVADATSGHSFSSAPAASQAGRYLKVTDRSTFYRIVTHTAGTTPFTIDAAYVEESGSGLAYLSIPLTYDLGAGILRICEPIRHYETINTVEGNPNDESGKITGLELNSFRDMYPRWSVVEGLPTRFTRQRFDENQCILEFNRYPAAKMKVDADVIEIPAGLIDSSESVPLLPRPYRDVLETGAAHFVLVDKEDEKATYFYNATKAKLMAMVKQNRKDITYVSKTKGQLYARQEQASPARRLYY